ncbi:hypothetical protein [Flagellimonas abyssi]|uniref:Antitoxin component YwqK of the YwqJK toxin-antitoxin module n=1 Tax=Flagellimonas abyssi TaxID=2864871 RepID=A0ABS7ETG0_9FLAO|nr:hypothetical protein [Allomuricauda abyssi]MBW8200889.1 hypothetical protein [Allomuricauda abyssi]
MKAFYFFLFFFPTLLISQYQINENNFQILKDLKGEILLVDTYQNHLIDDMYIKVFNSGSTKKKLEKEIVILDNWDSRTERLFYENGELQSESRFKNGVLYEQIHYYDNGSVRGISIYNDKGKKISQKNFDYNGKLYGIYHAVNDSVDTTEFYFKDGKTALRKSRTGEDIITEYYNQSNGLILAEETITSTYEKECFYSSDGDLLNESDFTFEFLFDVKKSKYGKNRVISALKIIGNFENGFPQGTVERSTNSKESYDILNYKNGFKHGLQQYFRIDHGTKENELVVEKIYKAGQLIEVKRFDKNNRIRDIDYLLKGKTKVFKDGVPQYFVLNKRNIYNRNQRLNLDDTPYGGKLVENGDELYYENGYLIKRKNFDSNKNLVSEIKYYPGYKTETYYYRREFSKSNKPLKFLERKVSNTDSRNIYFEHYFKKTGEILHINEYSKDFKHKGVYKKFVVNVKGKVVALDVINYNQNGTLHGTFNKDSYLAETWNLKMADNCTAFYRNGKLEGTVTYYSKSGTTESRKPYLLDYYENNILVNRHILLRSPAIATNSNSNKPKTNSSAGTKFYYNRDFIVKSQKCTYDVYFINTTNGNFDCRNYKLMGSVSPSSPITVSLKENESGIIKVLKIGKKNLCEQSGSTKQLWNISPKKINKDISIVLSPFLHDFECR